MNRDDDHVRARVSPHVVLDVLGHNQIALTLDTYSCVMPAFQDDAAAKVEALLEAVTA